MVYPKVLFLDHYFFLYLLMILFSPENKFILFDNDTNVIISDKSSNNLNYKLQSAFDDIFLCSKLNKLSINIDKTHCM